MEPVNSATNNVGYGLIGAYILVYIGLGVCTCPLNLCTKSTDGRLLGDNGAAAASDIPCNNNDQRRYRVDGLQKGVHFKPQRRRPSGVGYSYERRRRANCPRLANHARDVGKRGRNCVGDFPSGEGTRRRLCGSGWSDHWYVLIFLIRTLNFL